MAVVDAATGAFKRYWGGAWPAMEIVRQMTA